MAHALDTLGYAKRLRDAGIPVEQAEAHAEAAREFIMAELVTKPDLLALRQDLTATKQELQTSIATLRQEVQAAIDRLTAKLDLTASKQELQAAIQTIELRLTIRTGGMLAVAVAVLAAIIKL